jgi:hypothetical protein
MVSGRGRDSVVDLLLDGGGFGVTWTGGGFAPTEVGIIWLGRHLLLAGCSRADDEDVRSLLGRRTVRRGLGEDGRWLDDGRVSGEAWFGLE